MAEPMFTNVDCVSFYTDDLDKGIEFYCSMLNLRLLWRADKSCGLGLSEGITELVLVNEHNPAANFKVNSVEEALPEFTAAGGKVEYGPVRHRYRKMRGGIGQVGQQVLPA